jgi:hypothetical protein
MSNIDSLDLILILLEGVTMSRSLKDALSLPTLSLPAKLTFL